MEKDYHIGSQGEYGQANAGKETCLEVATFTFLLEAFYLHFFCLKYSWR